MRWALGILTVTVFLAAGANALAQTAQTAQTGVPAQPGQPNPEAQAAETLQSCFRCHGPNGVSRVPTHPTIAGQKADYVARQLHTFKRAAAAASVSDTDGDTDDGAQAETKLPARADPVMAHMAEELDDAQIGTIAAALSKLACDGGETQAQSVNPLAMPQAGQGCAACHGEDGIGRLPHIPNVAGQQRAYLRRQLLLIRETAWGAAPRAHENWRSHPIMERQAARISIEDVDALARYYAALDCRGAGTP